MLQTYYQEMRRYVIDQGARCKCGYKLGLTHSFVPFSTGDFHDTAHV